MSEDAVSRLLAGIELAEVGARGVFADDALLDATVPDWRFTVRGAARIEAQLDHWFAHRGTFEELERVGLPEGELVRFFKVWEEDGIAHGCHQTHVLRVRDNLVVADTMFCGGQWPASRMAEMEEAARAQ